LRHRAGPSLRAGELISERIPYVVGRAPCPRSECLAFSLHASGQARRRISDTSSRSSIAGSSSVLETSATADHQPTQCGAHQRYRERIVPNLSAEIAHELAAAAVSYVVSELIDDLTGCDLRPQFLKFCR